MFVKNIRTYEGDYGNSTFIGEVEVDYVYGTDRFFTVVTSHDVPADGVTQYFQYVATKTDTTTPFRACLGRAVGTGSGNFTLADSPSGDLAGPWSNSLNQHSRSGSFELKMGLAVNLTSEDQAGNYFVTEQIWNDGESEPEPVTITTFDLRVLALQNLRADRGIVSTNGKIHTTTIKGDWMALPVSTDLYPDGWAPTSDIAYSIPIVDPSEAPVKTLSGTSSVTINDAGKVGTLQMKWDCKDDQNKFAEGPRDFSCIGNAQVPGAGSTSSIEKNNQVLCLHCIRRHDGVMVTSIPLDGVGEIDLGMSYNGQQAADEPASMGFGWNTSSNISVFEDPDNSDLSYRDESGGALRWGYSGGTYVPYFKDNYVTAVKVTGNPGYVYAITFPDQSQRQFGADGKISRELDRNGFGKTYAYTAGHLTSITDDAGRAVYLGYGNRTDGQLASLRVNDPNTGRLTSFEYYPDTDPVSPNRLWVITSQGESTTFVYDVPGNIVQIKDTRNHVAAAYTYDDLGRKLTEQHYDQLLTTYSYPSSSMITITEHDLTGAAPDRSHTQYYDGNFNVVKIDEVVDNTTVNTSTMSYQDPLNPYLVTQSVAPNLTTTNMTYNSRGNLRTVQNAQGAVTLYEYAEDIDSPLNPKHVNLLRKLHRPTVTVDGSATTYSPTELQYDDNGNLISVIDPAGHSTGFTLLSDGLISAITDRRGFTTGFTYSSRRNLETVTTPSGPGAAPSRTTTFSYDDFDNMISVTNPLQNSITYEFDDLDRPTQVTDARGKYVLMSYLNGLLESVEAPANAGSNSSRRLTSFSYDTSNRLTATTSQISSSASQLRVGYDYNGFSNLKQLQRLMNGSSKSTSYQYDQLGRLNSATDFLGNASTVAYAPFCAQNTVTTPRGVQTTSYFDTLCRLTKRETQDEVHIFAYDELDRPISATVGNRYGTDIPYGQGVFAHLTRYRFDQLDRVTHIDYPNGASVAYQYDEEGNVLQIQDQISNRTTAYNYYNDGRLHQVTYQRPGQDDQVFTYTYDAAGRPYTITYPDSTDLVASFTKTDGSTGWNENGQLLTLRYLKEGNHFQRFEYTYDDSGNRTRMIDTPLNTAAAVTWDYNYDWLNRLTQVSRNNVSSSVYAYDESDNRVSLQLPPSGEVWRYSYDLADRIQNRTLSLNGADPVLYESYAHDVDGNMTSRTLAGSGAVTTYTWNTLDKLRQRALDSVAQETTSYDSGGIRRLKKDNTTDQTTKYFSSGTMSLADQLPSNSISFIQGHQLLGMESSGNVYYYITDGLGSVRVLVDSSGDGVASANYDEFGNSFAVTDPNNLMFHGYVGGAGVRNETAGSGLLYMRQRWYDAQLGRFISRDPIGFRGGLNAFAYVGNNPTNRVDPDGLAPVPPVGPFIGGIGGVVVGGYFIAKYATEKIYGSRTDWYKKAEEIISNADQYGVDPDELASVIHFYEKRFHKLVNMHCQFAQWDIYKALTSQFPNLKTIRFRRAFFSKTGSDLNPDNVVQIIPITHRGGRVADQIRSQSIFFYGGLSDFNPIQTGPSNRAGEVDDAPHPQPGPSPRP